MIGDLDGLLEPCGCGSRTVGGVDRLASAVADARREAGSSFLLASGNLFFDDDAQQRAERQQDLFSADVLAAVLGRIGLELAAPGALDLVRAREQLVSLTRNAQLTLLGEHAADEGSMGLELQTLVRSALRRVGDVQVGFTAATIASAGPAADLARVLAALKREVAALRGRGADVVIALVHSADATKSRQLADQISADVVVHSGPSALESRVTRGERGALLLYAGRRGEGVLSAELWPAEQSHGAWQLVSERPPATPARRVALVRYRALDASVPQDAQIRALLEQLFARINAHNAQHATEAREPSPGKSSYVGSDTCAACHTQAYFWWRNTPHGRAFQTLRARGRQLDLDCIGCHVTGYDRPGGATVARLAHLENVGCESCHGPGSAHADNPQPPYAVQRQVSERVCVECHDREHDEQFVYAPARAALVSPAHIGH